ncbi:MAG: hypothetical protein LBR20_02375 [Propionibacteriaceae bacterium]|jgi:DNA-binding transcriptional regulator LsrR (DeoR family)|nr:hypothetical protein [Propionibacteriaceae bacterium]
MREEKAKRLEYVARAYYEQDLTQAQIAAELGTSRPFVSKLLQEAKAAGIVEIRINSPLPTHTKALTAAKSTFGIRGGALIQPGEDAGQLDTLLSMAAARLIEDLGGGRLGLAWGAQIGAFVATIEKHPNLRSKVSEVCPLVGNRGVPIRYYHSSENALAVARQLGAQAFALNAPALVETPRELESLRATEGYQAMLDRWNHLDVALVNVGNHPSTPDFATQARFGKLLTVHRAVGHLVAYCYNRPGHIIHSDHDYAVQIPLESLGKTKSVIGLCNSTTSPDALRGALRTGLLTHVVAPEPLITTILQTEAA